MSESLWIVSITISNLIAQTEAAPPQKPDNLTQLMEWVNQLPGIGLGLAVFALISIAIAAVAKLTGNLDKILSFIAKYSPQNTTELSESQLKDLRQQLLSKMSMNVAQRQRDSLHKLIAIDLEQEEQRHQVGRQRIAPLAKQKEKKTRPFSSLIQKSLRILGNNPEAKPVASTEKTYTIFHRTDVGGRLLILGEPGAGKTTELLIVAQRLVDEATKDSAQPIPLIFELSSWEENTPTLTWLSQQLAKTYRVSEKLAEPLARRWVQQNQLLLLLDGLDELGTANQIACIETLEKFLGEHPTLPVVVCCRREEYEQGGEQLRQLNGAIYLQTVGTQQIQQYLKDLKQDELWVEIQTNPELLELARLPLFLTMLVIAYRGQPIQSTEALFNAYIQKQLHDPSHQGSYGLRKGVSTGQTLHYLGWLSRQLKQRNETEFLIENLQPDWLTLRYQRRCYRLIVGLIGGLILGLIGGLIVGLIGGLIWGLIGGLIWGLIGGLMWGAFGGPQQIKPQEKLKWSFRKGLIGGLIGGLMWGLMWGLIGGLMWGLIGGLIWGLIGGLIGGLICGLIGGLENEAIERKQIPNQGIRKSIHSGLIWGLIFGLIGGLIWGLMWGLIGGLMWGLIGGLMWGLIFGLICGLRGGLAPSIQHFILRLFLMRSGDTPWNYARFLEHAARHRFIQRTGGRYRFVHDLLRQHFAQMTPEQQADLAQNDNC